VVTGLRFATHPRTTYVSDECRVHSDCNEKQLNTALSDIIRTNQVPVVAIDIIQTNQVRAVAIIYSAEAVLTIAYGLLVHFLTWLPAGFIA